MNQRSPPTERVDDLSLFFLHSKMAQNEVYERGWKTRLYYNNNFSGLDKKIKMGSYNITIRQASDGLCPPREQEGELSSWP